MESGMMDRLKIFELSKLLGKSARTKNCHTRKSYKSNVGVSLHKEKVIER